MAFAEDAVSRNAPLEIRLSMDTRNWRIYVLLFAASVLIRIACFTGLIGSDDLEYAYFGELLRHGTYALQTHQSLTRVGVTFPVGLAYWLFGISEWSTVLVPLVTSSAAPALLFALGRSFVSPRAALLAAILLATFPVQVHHASILIPEPLMECGLLIALLLFLRGDQKRDIRWIFAAGICFGLSYLAKEVALFTGFAVLLYEAIRRRWKMALALVAGMTVVGLLEVCTYRLTTGDFLFRPHLIAQSTVTYYRYVDRPSPLLWRLLEAYPLMALKPNLDFGLHGSVALVLAAVALWYRRTLMLNQVPLLVLWFVIPGLYLNFGSASLDHYVPTPEAPRYISLLFPPAFLLTGALLDWLAARNRAGLSVSCAVIGILTVSGFACAFVSKQHGYRTSQIAVLRQMERTRNRWRIAAFRGPDASWWQCSAVILQGGLDWTGRCSGACLTVEPDLLGLPSASADVTEATKPNPSAQACWPAN